MTICTTALLNEFIAEHIEQTLSAYRAQPARIIEDARQEEAILSGGYGHRQLFELIQNAADAISEHGLPGRVQVRLTPDWLYCANEGAPLSKDGIQALLMAHLSPKRQDEIGRFGIGFKSVLGICDYPEIISERASFRFNPPELAEHLQVLVSPEDPIPKLRTAMQLDHQREAAGDPILAELLSWATTVVRLRLKQGVAERIGAEIKAYPSAFLAFSRHIAQLDLVIPGNSRRLTVLRGHYGDVAICDNDDLCRWHVYERKVLTASLPEGAREDMDLRLRERKALPLMWAVPVSDGNRQRSCFWAFFPTKNDTTLRGILNAPWKTNSDRENLLDGEFNSEMLRRAAELVAENLPSLNTTEDPAAFLDVLPARDDVGWADKTLSQHLLEILRNRPCIPRSQEFPELPANVKLRPDIADEPELQAWLNSFRNDEADGMAHETISGRVRRGKAKLLLGCPGLSELEWIQSIVAPKSPRACIAALHLADSLLRCEELKAGIVKSIRSERLVLTVDGKLVPPNPASLAFADGDAEAQAEHDRLVHQGVAGHPGARRILEEQFGIKSVDMAMALKALVSRHTWAHDDKFWLRFWTLVRGIAPESAKQILQHRDGWWVRCRTVAGNFEPINELLLPGMVAQPGDPEAQFGLIDLDFHQEDGEILDHFGASSEPKEIDRIRGDLFTNDIYAEHVNWARQEYRRQNPDYSPHKKHLTFNDEQAIAPIEPVRRLKGESAVRMTEALLTWARRQPKWTMGHETRQREYPETEIDSAILWAIRKYGWVDTSLGPARCQDCAGPQFEDWSELFAVAQITEEDAALLQLSPRFSTISSEVWNSAIQTALSYSGPDGALGSFYARAAEYRREAPREMRCRHREEWSVASPNDVTIIGDVGEREVLENKDGFYLCVSDPADAQRLVTQWGCKSSTPGEIRFVEAAESLLVSEQFPNLAANPGLPDALRLQPCESLWLERRSSAAGSTRTHVEQCFRGNCLYYVGERNVEWQLAQLAVHFPATLSEERRSETLRQAHEESRELRLEKIRRVELLHLKLLEAVGIEELRSRIPQRHLERFAASSEDSPETFAKLALAVHGIGVLAEYRDAFVRLGLQPPRRWNGNAKAVAFVRDLGFPEEYAGDADSERSPWVDTVGPIVLKDLHGFQKQMRDEIVEFLNSSPPSRGLLSLPTGAGKTRVAVQSIVEWIKMRGRDTRILWIAQSDELCEQSVESWLQGWRALGPLETRLRVNRMWGRTNERVRPPQAGSTLVVSTFQTLNGRLERRDLDWALEPDVVVVDEAHGATAPSYTRILRRLGLDQRETRVPLIGLTATPFRGENDERETYRLAFRFEHRRFDKGIGEPQELYRKLQEQRVLAWADHEELPGEEITLSSDELEQLRQFMVLPRSAEERLGNVEERNDRILEHLRNQPENWPILVFATSVGHAEDLAVRLSMDGVPAAAISGNTPPDRRRHAIASFKNGGLRVLTNYGVLTTGFDAPSVRAVYVARPVYSPVLYQQMIGRGLRGPLNGGKERCLIVNVTDNVEQYGEALAFQKFEHFWH